MGYWYHIWTGAPHSACNEWIRNCLHGLVDDIIFYTLHTFYYRLNVACILLFYRYFHKKCSDEINFFVPVSLISEFGQWKPLHMDNHLLISLVRNKLHLDSLFPNTVTLWNRFPVGYFLISKISTTLCRRLSFMFWLFLNLYNITN